MSRILFLAANPIDQAHLRVRQEFDELRRAVDSVAHGRRFELIKNLLLPPITYCLFSYHLVDS